MKHLTLTYLFTALLLSSCSKGDYAPTFTDFPETVEAWPIEQIQLDSVYFTYPKMKVEGNICCLSDVQGPLFLHLYTFPDFKYIRSLCREGRAGNELLGVHSFDLKDGLLYAYSTTERKILVYDIARESNEPIRRIDYAREADLYGIYLAAGDVFLGSNYTGDKRVTCFDEKGTVVSSHLEIPMEENELLNNPQLVSTRWQSMIGVSTDEAYIVLSTLNGDLIEVFDSQLNLITRIVGELGRPETLVVNVPGGTMYPTRCRGYGGVCLASSIYALFDGRDYMFKGGENSLRVFSYDGKPLKRYLFKGIDSEHYHTPNSVYVDEEAGFFYCAMPDSEQVIWKFAL